jgi:hypothetical protein
MSAVSAIILWPSIHINPEACQIAVRLLIMGLHQRP